MGRLFGILGAMPSEIAMLKEHVRNQTSHIINPSLAVTTGSLNGREVCFAAAGVGTVAAARTATVLACRFNVGCIVFTGVAGGLKHGQRVGDVVLASDVVNYDLDATRFKKKPGTVFVRGQNPWTGWLEFVADSHMLSLARAIAPDAHVGRVATGSVFVDTQCKTDFSQLWNELGCPLACEMEMAAVAQVCCEFGMPFLGLRALSDTMDGDSSQDFLRFSQAAADSLWPIVSHIVKNFKGNMEQSSKL